MISGLPFRVSFSNFKLQRFKFKERLLRKLSLFFVYAVVVNDLVVLEEAIVKEDPTHTMFQSVSLIIVGATNIQMMVELSRFETQKTFQKVPVSSCQEADSSLISACIDV